MLKRFVLPFVLSALALIVAIGILPQGNVALAQIEVTTPVITGPTTLVPLSSNVFTASGFASTTQVEILINGVRMARGLTNGSGLYTATIATPRSLAFGTTTVLGRDANLIQDSYVADVEPAILATITSGSPGTPFRVNGYAFSVQETYVMTFTEAITTAGNCVEPSATVSETLGTGTTTLVGSFQDDTEVPDVPDDTYYVVAYGATSQTCAVLQ
jgi:hypothetical protein